MKANLFFILSTLLFISALLLTLFICFNDFICLINFGGIIGVIILVISGIKSFGYACQLLSDELNMSSKIFENEEI